MKTIKKLLIATVAIAMIAATLPVSAAVTVINSYLDLKFENNSSEGKAWLENSSTDSAKITLDKLTGYTVQSAGCAPENIFDAMTGSRVLKFTMAELGSDKVSTRNWFIGQDSQKTSATGLDSKVTWYEVSFKFDTAVSGISMDAASSKPIFYIAEDGHIYLDPNENGYSGGTKVTSEPCVAGKWYHLVIAYDYVEPYKVSTTDIRPQVYAFLNGQQLASINESSRTKVTELNRVRLYSHKSNSGKAVKYVDNFKIYTTANSVATDLKSGAFDPMDIYDGTEITSDSLAIVGDKIYVDADATLREVDGAITVTTSKVYYDGTTAVSDMETNAIGKIVCVRSTSGIGVKTYTIAQKEAYMPAEAYFNMNFDGSTGKENIAANALNITDWQTTNSSTENDTIRNSKIKSVTRSSTSELNWGKLSNTILIGTASNLDIDISKRTAWYELSFKLDDLNGGIGIFDQTPIFSVSPGGAIRLGGLETWTSGGVGQEVTNAKIEAGKWYHMVVAIDSIDKSATNEESTTTYPKVYAWLNGKLLLTGTAAGGSSMLWVNSAIGNKDEIDRVRVQYYFPKYENEVSVTSTGYIDNFKLYTTYTPVLDSDGNYSIDPLADYAKVSSGTLTVVDDAIYAAENASFADIHNALTLIDAGAVVNASGTDISESTVTAKDNTIYVRSESGIGINTYTVKAAPEYGIITDTATWTVADRKATLTTYFSNRGAEKGCVLILASYDSEGLVNVCTTDITNVPTAGKKIVSNPIEVESNDLTIRAFVWSSKSGLIPLTTVCDSLPAYAG